MLERLRAAFSYDPLLGILIRNANGAVHNNKNKRISFEGKRYAVTHVIWVVHFGYWPTQLIDHKDGDQSNNRLSNLREASPVQNTFNRPGVGQWPKGVVFKADANRSKPWSARIRINGKRKLLGTFATMEEAADAYRQAAEIHQGQFAVHNS